MIGYSPMMAPLSLGDRSRIALGQVVTSNHFSMLGIQPFLGRLLVPSDDEPGAPRVVVLSHRMWQREFGSDPAIVGKSITLRGLPYTIAGVAPPSFTGVVALLTPELWLPIAHVEEVEPAGIIDSVPSPIGTTRLERRGMRWMFIKGRLKPGVSAAQAHANVALIGRQLATAHVQTNKDRQMAAVPTEDVRMLVPQAGGVLSIGAAGLMTIVGLVLLIACANVAGMLLARASARRREISVRLAIGASRGRLIQQLLVEGALLGTLGAIAAVALAWALVQGAAGHPAAAAGRRGVRSAHRCSRADVLGARRRDDRHARRPAAGAEGLGAKPRRRPARRSAGGEGGGPALGAARRAGRDAGGADGGAARGGGPAACAASARRSAPTSASRSTGSPRSRSTPTWCATRRSGRRNSGARRRRASARCPACSRHRPDLADAAVHVQLQPAGDARRQSHLQRGPARRDHRERRHLRAVSRHARRAGDRRPRHRRHRPRRRAGCGGDQRDHGAHLLAEGIRRGPHLPDRQPRTLAHLSHRRRRARSQAARRARAAVAVRLLRRRAAPEPTTTSCSRARAAMPRRC